MKNALFTLKKCLEINPENEIALKMHKRLEEEINRPDNLTIGQAELTLKKHNSNFNSNKLVFE